MPEFRKLFDLPAAKLSRADLEDLGQLISDGMPFRPDAFEFSVSDGDATYQAQSLDELLSQELPQSIDSLSFRVHGWTDDNRIDRGVSLNLTRTTASCQIHSYDEVWFKGKIQQIMEFFTRRGTWYSKIRGMVPFLFGFFVGAPFVALLFFLSARQFLFALVSGITLAALVKIISAHVNGRLFPLIDIQLSEKPRRLDRETFMVVIAAIGALATVAGVIVQLMQKASP